MLIADIKHIGKTNITIYEHSDMDELVGKLFTDFKVLKAVASYNKKLFPLEDYSDYLNLCETDWVGFVLDYQGQKVVMTVDYVNVMSDGELPTELK